MRPIDRGNASSTYANYQDAKPDLVKRLGTYCSYCERRVTTNLAIEHILPKDENLPYSHLRNEWTNFLLGCVNCNSAKKTEVVDFDQYVLPDRDNTFMGYVYEETGLVTLNTTLTSQQQDFLQNTINMVAINRYDHINWDQNTLFTALERFSQRIQAWEQAKEAREDYDNGEVNLRRICREACATGFFSIWMAVFEGVPAVRKALINAFPNTAQDCFDENGNPISPRPQNGLQSSGKI